jgi:PhnB protein
MAKMHPYLNFDGNAEEAFNFYKSVFGGEFHEIHKMAEMPESDKLPENERNRIMHMSLPVDGEFMLMGADIMPSYGQTHQPGNNIYLSLHPETKEEADKLFKGLSEGGDVEMPLSEAFWGAYFGTFTDKFGIKWMINHQIKK